MKTQSKTKIAKAQRLLKLVEDRKAIEREEAELKAYFKGEAVDGVLDCGDVLVLVRKQVRVNLDKEGLRAELGKGFSKFELPVEYEVVIVERKMAS